MVTTQNWRWRKISDISRENAIFELMDDQTPMLDVGFSDAGKFEISFNPGVFGKILDWTELQELVEEGRILAERDR